MSVRLFDRLGALALPRRRALVGCVALVLLLPSVFSGFSTDDHWLRYELLRSDAPAGTGTPPFELFRWFDAAAVKTLVDDGMLPWWTHERAFMAFLRPLSSLTHTIDHVLWPDHAVAMHLSNLFWFCCLLVVTRRVYFEVLGRTWVAGVATAFFALNHAHGVAVGWISNRSAVLGALFGTAALLCHHRFRSGAGARYAGLAVVCLALSLASTEAGVSSACYVLAYALLFERGPVVRRITALVPYAALFVAWLVVRRAGGYGTFAMGGYIDPVHQPLAFLATFPERVTVIFGSQLAAFSADVYAWTPAPYQWPILAFLLVGIVLAAWFGWRSLREERAIQFFLGGAVLAALPLVAALPSDRLLAPIGLGVMPFLAHGIYDALAPARRAVGRAARVRVGLAGTVTVVHLVISPVVLSLNALAPAFVEHIVAAAEESAPADRAIAAQTLIVTEVTESAIVSYLRAMRAVNGRPSPERVYWLGATRDPVQFERVGARTLRARAPAGLFSDYWIDRASTLPLAPGDRVQLADLEVRVLEVTPDGRPSLADFVFVEGLESGRYRWVAWKGDRFEEIQVPQANEEYRAARGG